MKTGDQVTIKDGSYMLTVKDGKLSHSGEGTRRTIGWCKDAFTIIHVGCGQLPSEKSHATGNRYQNDTIIQHNKSGEIWFCGVGVNIELIEEDIPELTMEQAIRQIGFEFKIVKE